MIDGCGYPFLAHPLNDVSIEKANLGFISVSFPLMMGIVAASTELSSGAMGGVSEWGKWSRRGPLPDGQCVSCSS